MTWPDPEVISALAAIALAIESQSGDGVLFEDERIIVQRKNGNVSTAGKPMRNPFYYEVVTK